MGIKIIIMHRQSAVKTDNHFASILFRDVHCTLYEYNYE